MSKFEISFESVPVVLFEVIGRANTIDEVKKIIREDFLLSGEEERKYKVRNVFNGVERTCTRNINNI